MQVCVCAGACVRVHTHTTHTQQMPGPKTAKEKKASKRLIAMGFAKIRLFYFIKQTTPHLPLLIRWRARIKTLSS